MEVDSKMFSNALSTASKWVPKKPVIEATGGYLLDFQDGYISLSAIDPMGSDITLYVSATGYEGESMSIVKAAKLNNTVHPMSKTGENIEIYQTGNYVTLKCGGHVTEIATTPVADFPKLRGKGEGPIFVIDKEGFVKAVNQAKGIADPDDPRGSLSGVYFCDGDVVTTDGVRMVVSHNVEFTPFPSLIPVTFCNNIASALSGAEGDISVQHNEQLYLVFEWDVGRITVSLINKEFPDYKMMLPDSCETEAVIPYDDLRIALDMAAPFASETEQLLFVNILDGKIIMRSVSTIGSHISEVNSLEKIGEDVAFGVSCKFLREAVARVGNEVYIRANGPRNIIIVSDGENYVYGIMPMHIEQ